MMSRLLLVTVALVCVAAAACVVASPVGWLPDSSMTPGATYNVDAATVCQPGYAGKTRNVPQSEKNAVYKSYGVAAGQGYCSCDQGCEIDHLISLEIGGSNDQTNLWPQPYTGITWTAHMKDQLENYLHHAMCTNQITMATAQQQISTNWIKAYQQYTIGSHAQLSTPLWQKVQAYEAMFENGHDVYGEHFNRFNTTDFTFTAIEQQ